MTEARRIGRRQLLADLARGAGVSAAVLALFRGSATRAFAEPAGTGQDLEILNAALALEHQAIALYDVGLARNLVPVVMRERAVEFRGDHQGHRDTQVSIARERGGDPVKAQARYEFGHMDGGRGWLRKAAEVELAAQQAYAKVIPLISAKDYQLAASFIVIDEVRHLTVWRSVLRARSY
jgi:hypothetical protein